MHPREDVCTLGGRAHPRGMDVEQTNIFLARAVFFGVWVDACIGGVWVGREEIILCVL